MSDRRYSFSDLVEIMARLRAPDGCPWDREQTPASLRPYLLEEAHETLEAIETGDAARLRDELGDLLLQVVFHAQMQAEAGAFTIEDVVDGIARKLVRRHPHVFGEVEADTPQQVIANWEAIKAHERGRERARVDEDIPSTLPALMRAEKLLRRAARQGFRWPDLEGALRKMAEEHDELGDAARSGGQGRVAEELGDLLFTAVNVAVYAGVDSEQTLLDACRRFARRFGRVEAAARASGRRIEDLTVTELLDAWEQSR